MVINSALVLNKTKKVRLLLKKLINYKYGVNADN